MGDGSGISVDFGAIGQAAGDIGSIAAQIDQALDTQESQIKALETEWEGGASSGFQATKHKWQTAAKDLQATLAKIGSAVHVANENYLQTESRNSQRWS